MQKFNCKSWHVNTNSINCGSLSFCLREAELVGLISNQSEFGSVTGPAVAIFTGY